MPSNFLLLVILPFLLPWAMGSTSPGCCPMKAEWTHPTCGFGVRNESGIWNSTLQVELRVTQVPELCACELICIASDGFPLLYVEDLPCVSPIGTNRVHCTLPALGETGLPLQGCERWAVAALDDGGYGDFCYLTAESGDVLDGMVWSRTTGEWECGVGHLCPPEEAPITGPAPFEPPAEPPIVPPVPIPIANDTFQVQPSPLRSPIFQELASPPSTPSDLTWAWILGTLGVWLVLAAGIVALKRGGGFHWVATKARHRCCGSKKARRAMQSVEMQSLVQASGAPRIGDSSEESLSGSGEIGIGNMVIEEILPPPRTVAILDISEEGPVVEPIVCPEPPQPPAPSNPDPLPMPMVAVASPAEVPKSPLQASGASGARARPKAYIRYAPPPAPHEPVL